MIDTYRMVLLLLDRSEQRRICLVIVMVVTVGALVEASSVASVLPLLSILANPEVIEMDRYLAWAYNFLGVQSVRQFQIILVFVLFAMVVKPASVYAVRCSTSAGKRQ